MGDEICIFGSLVWIYSKGRKALSRITTTERQLDPATKFVLFLFLALVAFCAAAWMQDLAWKYTLETPGEDLVFTLFPDSDFGGLLAALGVNWLLWFLILWWVTRVAQRFRERHSRH